MMGELAIGPPSTMQAILPPLFERTTTGVKKVGAAALARWIIHGGQERVHWLLRAIGTFGR